MITTQQAATLLGCSVPLVTHLARKWAEQFPNSEPPVKFGHSWLFNETQVELMRGRRTAEDCYQAMRERPLRTRRQK